MTNTSPKKILVTGAAGFIGSALAGRLRAAGHHVTGIDNFNPYYDITLKRDRITHLLADVQVRELDITDADALSKLFQEEQFDTLCHLAAQAGVRYSVTNPDSYIHNNVQGMQTLLAAMQAAGVPQLVYASTSSVYGTNTPAPFSETAPADRPVSIYAATKRAGELLARSYASQYGLQVTALRFFTVFGPWSRPDMAMLKFLKKMDAGEPIEVYNHGDLRRDFTYIDDITAGFEQAVNQPFPYEIINLGYGQPVELMTMIETLEQASGQTAKKNYTPMQTGDVYETYADTSKAAQLLNFTPQTDFATGVQAFVDWYREYYQSNKS